MPPVTFAPLAHPSVSRNQSQFHHLLPLSLLLSYLTLSPRSPSLSSSNGRSSREKEERDHSSSLIILPADRRSFPLCLLFSPALLLHAVRWAPPPRLFPISPSSHTISSGVGSRDGAAAAAPAPSPPLSCVRYPHTISSACPPRRRLCLWHFEHTIAFASLLFYYLLLSLTPS